MMMQEQPVAISKGTHTHLPQIEHGRRRRAACRRARRDVDPRKPLAAGPRRRRSSDVASC
jgi:hypothetical protein